MNERVSRFFEEIKEKEIAFVGMGVSHFDMIKQFVAKGCHVHVIDKREAEKLGDGYPELRDLGVQFHLGEGYLDDLCQFDIILRTPGMYFYHPSLVEARRHGVVVTSEMELFFDFCPCPIYAVTGSDGKTTTTTLIAEMFEKAGKRVHKGGNIGRALFPIIEEVQPEDVAVVELSSFQLISMRKSGDVSVVTNIAPNHLDVHKDMEEYIDAKKNVLLHQNAFSRSVLNLDNELSNGLEPICRGEVYKFSRRQPVEKGAYLTGDGKIVLKTEKEAIQVMEKSDILLPGEHNVENYLTAICAVAGKVEPQIIRDVARTFTGVEHRIELVRELRGVKYYNDSIASSPTRTIAGLDSFHQKVILLAGGYDKKIPFEPLAPKIVEKVKLLILSGPTAAKIRAAVESCPGYAESGLVIKDVKDLDEGVAYAVAHAKEGDIVTLSPACASFDAFPNFEVRGRYFKKLIAALQ